MEMVWIIFVVIILIITIIVCISMLSWGKGYREGFANAENLYERILRRKEVDTPIIVEADKGE